MKEARPTPALSLSLSPAAATLRVVEPSPKTTRTGTLTLSFPNYRNPHTTRRRTEAFAQSRELAQISKELIDESLQLEGLNGFDGLPGLAARAVPNESLRTITAGSATITSTR